MISHSRIKPSLITYTHVLKGFASLKDINNCKLIHEKLLFIGHEPDLKFYTILMRAYSQRGDVASVQSLHEAVLSSSTKWDLDVQYYNAIINMHAKQACASRNGVGLGSMVKIYEEMTTTDSIQPDEHTYTTMIDAFMKAGEVRMALYWFDVMTGAKRHSRQFVEPLGPRAHALIPIQPTTHTYTAIISGFARRKDLSEAMRWFQKLYAKTRDSTGATGASLVQADGPNLKTWTAILHGFTRVGNMSGAESWREAFRQELLEAARKSKDGSVTAKLDERVFNTMIGGYAQLQDYESASKVLAEMQEEGVESDAITYGLLISSHLKRTDTNPDGDLEAALLTYKRMMAKQTVSPTLHIFTSLISRLGHRAGKSDALGRPIHSRQGGGFIQASRVLQQPPQNLVRVYPDPSSPTADVVNDSVPKIQEKNLIHLYETYRKALPGLLGHATASPSTTLISAPLPIYDSVIAHFSTVHNIPKLKQVFYHAIVDGAPLDSSVLIRAMKGVGRTAGWNGIYSFGQNINTIVTDLRRIREVKALLSKESFERDRRDASSSSGFGTIDGLLMPITLDSKTLSQSEKPGIPEWITHNHKLGKLVTSVLKDVENVESVMPRWLGEDQHIELQNWINQALLATYPVFVLKKRGSDWDDSKDGITCASLLPFDVESRRHTIGVDLMTEDGAAEFWKLVSKLQVDMKGAQSVKDLGGLDFRYFVFVFIRHCEVTGLWKTRDECIVWLNENGARFDDGVYRRWLGSSK
ncbi:hypothetical protein BDR26DRAFT_868278 [Obelidium mucronatum]|nr:hypothetical protein BDR26DRAFT_868278 [Obelidium mucronatum]